MPKVEKNIKEYANIAIEKYSNYINIELELIAEGDDFKKETVIKTQRQGRNGIMLQLHSMA